MSRAPVLTINNVAALLVLVGLAVGGTLAGLRTPTFSSTEALYLTVSLPKDSGSAALQEASIVALNKAESYARLVRSPAVLGAVITELELNTTVSQLENRVTTSVEEGTSIIEIRATSTSAEEAAAIATTLGVQASSALPRLEPTSNAGLTLSPVGAPQVADNADPPGDVMLLGLGLVFGLACALTYLAFMKSRRSNSSDA